MYLLQDLPMLLTLNQEKCQYHVDYVTVSASCVSIARLAYVITLNQEKCPYHVDQPMLLTLNQEKCWHQMSPQHVFNGHWIVQKYNHQDHVPGLLLNSNQQQLVWGPRTALVAPYHPQCPTNAQNANTAHKCMGCTLGKRKHECRFPHPSSCLLYTSPSPRDGV